MSHHSSGKNSAKSVYKAFKSIEESEMLRDPHQIPKRVGTCTNPVFIHLHIHKFEERKIPSIPSIVTSITYAHKVTDLAVLNASTFIVHKNKLVPCTKLNLNKLLLDSMSTITTNENVFQTIKDIKKMAEKRNFDGIILTISSHCNNSHFIKTFDSFLHFETHIVKQFDDHEWKYAKSIDNFVRVFILSGCLTYDETISTAVQEDHEYSKSWSTKCDPTYEFMIRNENSIMFFLTAHGHGYSTTKVQVAVPYESFYHALKAVYLISENYCISFDKLGELMGKAHNICLQNGYIKDIHSIEISHGSLKKLYLLLNRDFTNNKKKYPFQIEDKETENKIIKYINQLRIVENGTSRPRNIQVGLMQAIITNEYETQNKQVNKLNKKYFNKISNKNDILNGLLRCDQIDVKFFQSLHNLFTKCNNKIEFLKAVNGLRIAKQALNDIGFNGDVSLDEYLETMEMITTMKDDKFVEGKKEEFKEEFKEEKKEELKEELKIYKLSQWKQDARIIVFLFHHILWIINIYGIIKLCFYLKKINNLKNLFYLSIICLILPYIYIWYKLMTKYFVSSNYNGNYLYLLLSSNPITSILLWIIFEYIDLTQMKFKDNFVHLNTRMNCELFFQLIFILLINIYLYILNQQKEFSLDTFLPSFIYTLTNLIYIFMHTEYCHNNYYYFNCFSPSSSSKKTKRD